LHKAKEERLNTKQGGSYSANGETDDNATEHVADGATGPDGTVVAFPQYDGSDEPRECKKAFTLFCNGTRREVKAKLDPSHPKDKV